MDADPFKGREYQAIMPRSAMTNLFFRLSFTCQTHLGALFAITYAQDRNFCLYTRIPFSLRICILLLAFAAIQAGKSVSMLDIFIKLLSWVVNCLRVRPSEARCCVVAILIKHICDSACLDHIDDTFSLVVLSALSFIMICVVATGWDSDHSGMTEGLILEFGKMLIVYMMSSKLWQSVICGLILFYAIVSKVTEIADGATVVANSLHVGCDNSTCLLQRIDSRAEYQAVMRRSAPAIMFFQVCFVFITVLGGLLAIMCAYYQTSSQYRTQLLSICVVLVTAASFVGGSTLYVKLLKWLLQCLQTREDKHWFVALAVMTLCDTFLDRDNMLPLAFLSVLSMIMICVLTTGWDSDRTGMTEGLLIGFGEWLLIYMINLKLLQAVICGLVLLFVVVSKLTEHADGANVSNSLRVGTNASTRYTAVD